MKYKFISHGTINSSLHWRPLRYLQLLKSQNGLKKSNFKVIIFTEYLDLWQLEVVIGVVLPYWLILHCTIQVSKSWPQYFKTLIQQILQNTYIHFFPDYSIRGVLNMGCVLIPFSRCKRSNILSHIIQNLKQTDMQTHFNLKKFMQEFYKFKSVASYSIYYYYYSSIYRFSGTLLGDDYIRNVRHIDNNHENKVLFYMHYSSRGCKTFEI